MTSEAKTYLTRLYIENYKSIGGPFELNLAPITLFYGPNSAGKSAATGALRLIGALCRAGDPFDFVSQLERAARNHDLSRDMMLGVSASCTALKAPINAKKRGAFTNDFAEQFPRLIGAFYQLPDAAPDDEPPSYEVTVIFRIEFDAEKETAIDWLRLEPEVSECERGEFGASWATEISVDAIPLLTLTTYSIYINESHPIIRTLDEELSEYGHTLRSLVDFFWEGKTAAGYLAFFIEHQFKDGVFYIDDDIALRFHDGRLPFEEFRTRYFQLRHILDFLVQTPLNLVADTIDQAACIGPTRIIPSEQDVTFLSRDGFVCSTLSGICEWIWCDGSQAWFAIVRDFNEHAHYAAIAAASDDQGSPETGDLLTDYGYVGMQLWMNPKTRPRMQQEWRRRAENWDLWRFKTIGLKEINDWLSPPQRLGLGHHLAITYTECSSATTVPGSEGLRADWGALPERLLLLRLIDERLGAPVNLDEVGVGIPQVVPVLAAGVLVPQSIVEQPELHLHPKLQTSLGDFFAACKNRHGHRFILETHSEHVALRLLRRIRETSQSHIRHVDYHLRPEDVAFFFFDAQEEATEIVPLRVSADGEFLDRWPRGFFSEREAELFLEDD
ncbi:AAA family ATPase [Halochromatium roseum]|uniref:AAA family ATPase n=1 Tax=Halochromatium roseum TaxID=391920 RepID=UPI001913D1C0|nr:DUF3696 domain-containing protein [Halochromatium roseum]MBK5941602.1 hypothetical protein [Halochromatium roseum]